MLRLDGMPGSIQPRGIAKPSAPDEDSARRETGFAMLNKCAAGDVDAGAIVVPKTSAF
jgi:hypothetical protein